MNTSTRSRSTLLLAALLWPASAAAQGQPIEMWHIGGWGPAQFGPRIAPGQFTPGAELDAVVLDDGTPSLLIAPESFLTRIDVPVVANDIATRPGIGGADTLLSVGPGGLRESSWSPGTGTWTATTIESTDWVDARRLLVGDLDGAGELDVAALGEASNAIEVLHGTTSGFASPESFSSAFPAYDIVLVDWNGEGADEIAVLSSWGVEVYDHEGALVGNLNLTYSPILAAAIDDGNPECNERLPDVRLACIVHEPGDIDKQWLLIWDAAGIEGPFFVGDGLGVRSLQSTDWNGDGYVDLVARTSTDHDVLIFLNQTPAKLDEPSTPRFAPSAPALGLVTSTADPAWTVATLGFGDFDSDGDVDAILPVQGNYDGGMIPSGETREYSQVYLLRNFKTQEADSFASVYAASKTFHSTIPDTQLELYVASPATDLAHDPYTEELALQYSVWHLASLEAWLDEETFVEGFLDYPDPTALISVWLGETTEDFEDIYAFRIRQVVKNTATGQIERVGPAQISMYTADLEIFEALDDLPWTTSGIPGMAYVLPSNGGGTEGGGVSEGPHLPPNEDDDVPGGTATFP